MSKLLPDTNIEDLLRIGRGEVQLLAKFNQAFADAIAKSALAIDVPAASDAPETPAASMPPEPRGTDKAAKSG